MTELEEEFNTDPGIIDNDNPSYHRRNSLSRKILLKTSYRLRFYSYICKIYKLNNL